MKGYIFSVYGGRIQEDIFLLSIRRVTVQMRNQFMELALQEAEKARQKGEVPVGAVIVIDNQVIATAHNEKEIRQDPTCHAEVIAIRKACAKLGTWRLSKAILYVTLEPCVMCAGAIVQARIDKVVFGASDLKGGACGTCFNLVENSLLNHQVEVMAGVMEEECKQILKDFFKQLRIKSDNGLKGEGP